MVKAEQVLLQNSIARKQPAIVRGEYNGRAHSGVNAGALYVSEIHVSSLRSCGAGAQARRRRVRTLSAPEVPSRKRTTTPSDDCQEAASKDQLVNNT
jgi:hypothetical protein